VGFRAGETSDYDFITNLLLSLLQRIFKIAQSGKVTGKKADCLSAVYAVALYC